MTFIIAELGINHNGDLDTAKKMVDAARWAGADAVKLQKRTVEIVYAGQLDQPRESPWGTTLGEQKFGLELTRDEYDAFDLYCAEQKMPWFASAWDIPSLEFLREYELPYQKVASAMVTHTEFVAEVAREGKPTFMSTAMCNLRQIFIASQYFDPDQLTLMHCVATYPAPEADLNLRAISALGEEFGLKVGYSGHEASVSPSVIAVVLGAAAVERHLTLDRSMYGSDQAASLEPHGFKTMVEQIRKLPKILGDGVKRVTTDEWKVAEKLRYWQRT